MVFLTKPQSRPAASMPNFFFSKAGCRFRPGGALVAAGIDGRPFERQIVEKTMSPVHVCEAQPLSGSALSLGVAARPGDLRFRVKAASLASGKKPSCSVTRGFLVQSTAITLPKARAVAGGSATPMEQGQRNKSGLTKIPHANQCRIEIQLKGFSQTWIINPIVLINLSKGPPPSLLLGDVTP
jgi:hypothetical protein